MNDVVLTEEQYAKALQIAAEVGARTALDRFEEEKQREAKELMDSRLRNTKLLLRNYRLFKAHVEIEKDENIAETIDAAVENGTKTSTIKSAITRKYKPEYQNGDSTRRKEIRIILGKTGLYGDSEDISETLDKWLEQAEDKD